MKKPLLFSLVLILGFAGAGCRPRFSPEPVACTMEAKLCPDGSYVGRQGPKCEFAPCPVVKDFSFNDQIRVPGSAVSTTLASPFTLRGDARGSWYFEGSFPVELRDADGSVIAMGVARAEGEWMTTNYVPFSTTLIFAPPSTATGTIVLKKDNPSGEPQNDASLEIPVRFTP